MSLLPDLLPHLLDLYIAPRVSARSSLIITALALLPLCLLIGRDGGGYGPVLAQPAALCRNDLIRSDLDRDRLLLAVISLGAGVWLLLWLQLRLLLMMADAISNLLALFIGSQVAVAVAFALCGPDGRLDGLGR